MPHILTPQCYENARRQFQSDPILNRVANHIGIEPLPVHADPFEALVRNVMYQQLAGKAAAAIYGRWRGMFDGEAFPSAEQISKVTVEEMRERGLSRPKAAYILDLCQNVIDGKVHFQDLQDREDDEIRNMIVQVKGFGVWTADMFLIFTLHRRDVWPTLDLGVKNGYRKLAGMESDLKPKELEPLGEPFRPYRSLASLYFWRALEPGAVPEA